MTRRAAGHRAAPLRAHQAPTLPRPGIGSAGSTSRIAALVTGVSVDASATFAILMGTFSISASMGSDIQIITRTTTRITIYTPIRTTMRIEA
jgi:hypothetical protein